jgi:putative Flp pilus-assembly TadE/G-like protein
MGQESGQVVAFVVLMMAVILGMAAFVVDLGFWYLDHNRAQAAADRGALTAAANLPSQTQPNFAGDATLASIDQANLATGSFQFTAGHSSVGAPYDTVQAKATKPSSVIFARVIGISSATVSATATAAVQSYQAHGWDTAPFAQDAPGLVFDTTVSIKVDSGGQVSPGNFGALDLKDAPDCQSSNGASNYRDLIGRTAHSCGLVVGDTVDTETGNMAGPTSQGLDARGVINNFDPNTLITSDGHGGQTVTDWNHPNLMVIPIIQAWSNGHASVTIVGFQYFIITSYTAKTISGMFVHLTGTAADWSCPTAQDPHASCPLGNYDPTSGPTVIRLIA